MAEAERDVATAKLFMHGRSQAVRLPKAFRFDGTEVRVSRSGDKVILEPMTPPPFDVDAWWARLRSFDDADFPEPADHPPTGLDDGVDFD